MNLIKYRENSLNNLMSKMDSLSNSINLQNINVSTNTRVYQLEQNILKMELSNMSVTNIRKLLRTINPSYRKINDYIFETFTVREKDTENYSLVYLAGHVYGLSKENMSILFESSKITNVSEDFIFNIYTTARDFYLLDYDEQNKSVKVKYLGNYYSSAIINVVLDFIREFMPDISSIRNLTEDNKNSVLGKTNYTFKINFK